MFSSFISCFVVCTELVGDGAGMLEVSFVGNKFGVLVGADVVGEDMVGVDVETISVSITVSSFSSDGWTMSDSVLQASNVNEAIIIVEKVFIIVIIVLIVLFICNESIY